MLAPIIIIVICGICCIGTALLTRKEYNRYIHLQNKNDTLYKENDDIRAAIDCNNTELHELQIHIESSRVEKNALLEQKQELTQDIAANMRQVEQLKENFKTTEEQFRRNYMHERQEWVEARQDEYLQMQKDFVEQFHDANVKKMTAAQALSDKLAELRSAADAAIEVAKRHAEEENFIAYHSLQLEEKALADIKKLEDIVPSVSQEAGEAIAKVIWKVYYEKPYGDMVGRILGNSHPTGIYRITNTRNSKCYIGQAVDIGDRWRQHIRRALNAEPRTQNKLYPAMYKEGIENFTFEVIEECTRDKLNEREDYWQDFYKAKEYGYSIK